MPKRAAPGKANTHAQSAKIDWPYSKYKVEGIKNFEFLSNTKRRLNEYESYLLVTHFPSQRRQYNSEQKVIKAAETQKQKSNEVVKAGKAKRAAGRANTQSGEGNPSNDDDGVPVFERGVAKVHLVF
jgi:hypothetical protein